MYEKSPLQNVPNAAFGSLKTQADLVEWVFSWGCRREVARRGQLDYLKEPTVAWCVPTMSSPNVEILGRSLRHVELSDFRK